MAVAPWKKLLRVFYMAWRRCFGFEAKNWGRRIVVTKLRTQMEYKWLSQTMRATAVLTKKLTE